jgi:ABC-2 type transport system permease protein
MIFGAIFSGMDETTYELHVQDLDESTWSSSYIDMLRNVSILKVETIESEEDISSYMKDEDLPGVLVIPNDFGEKLQQSFVDPNVTVNVSFYYDPSEQTSSSILQNIISSSLYEFNIGLAGGRRVIGIDQISSISEEFEFIDFFIPGIIGLTIMTSCVYGSIERNTKFRKDGILRKLLTMPVSRSEWILSKMLFMLFLSFISTLVILAVGIIVWDMNIEMNLIIFVIGLIILASFLFSGLGMIIGRFVKDEETADMAGGAITFPMMFLAGTFFPLDQMPEYLQIFAQVLPLYYVNEGLRNAMIYTDLDKTISFTAFVLIFALIFFVIGVILTKWKED